jgi:hypothetical protein
MSIKNKIYDFLHEDTVKPESVSSRQARLAIPMSTVKTEKKLKKWVKAILGQAPWLTMAITTFFLFASGPVASGALGYGLIKVSLAVSLAVLADTTMFRGQTQPKEHSWLPMIRRSLVFIGICWLMAVT